MTDDAARQAVRSAAVIAPIVGATAAMETGVTETRVGLGAVLVYLVGVTAWRLNGWVTAEVAADD